MMGALGWSGICFNLGGAGNLVTKISHMYSKRHAYVTDPNKNPEHKD